MPTHIHSYTGGHVFTNGYIIETEHGSIAIDAPARIAEWAQSLGHTPNHLLLTHQHFDHVEDVEALQSAGARISMHSAYSETLIRQKEAREKLGLPIHVTPFEADELLHETAKITLCELEFHISHIPGHSPDSISFYAPALGSVFVGDTLMAGACGRTDLPGGSFEQLYEGIHKHLYTLPDETKVYSGHGPITTIGQEKHSNPII